jgi:2-(1,2-epoxy-1,2-dihydrophenyl)acetyl-CoA isomerase
MPAIRLADESGGRRVRITLARPERLNAFDFAMLRELEQALLDAAARRPRAIVIDGEGKAFSAGGDLSIGADALPDLARQFHVCLRLIHAAPAPVVTLVGGVAAGGGFSLAAAGDMRLGTTQARFRIAYGRAGLSIDGGLSWRLPRLVGLAQAQRLLVEDPDLDAEEACRLGLLHRVVDPAAADAALDELTGQLELQARGSLARDKALLARALESTIEEALAREERAIAESASSPDGREGIAAFREKRPPKFA